METSICLLLYWAINLKQDREHHPRPLCWLELGRLIDRRGGCGWEGGREGERENASPRQVQGGGENGKGRGERKRRGEEKMREEEGGRQMRKEKGGKGKE